MMKTWEAGLASWGRCKLRGEEQDDALLQTNAQPAIAASERDEENASSIKCLTVSNAEGLAAGEQRHA